MHLKNSFVLEHEIITQKMVKKVMAATDRKYYCPNGAAYQDSPQSIGYGVTISAPHMVSTNYLETRFL